MPLPGVERTSERGSRGREWARQGWGPHLHLLPVAEQQDAAVVTRHALNLGHQGVNNGDLAPVSGWGGAYRRRFTSVGHHSVRGCRDGPMCLPSESLVRVWSPSHGVQNLTCKGHRFISNRAPRCNTYPVWVLGAGRCVKPCDVVAAWRRRRGRGPASAAQHGRRLHALLVSTQKQGKLPARQITTRFNCRARPDAGGVHTPSSPDNAMRRCPAHRRLRR